jgi:hypothetical protein
MPDVHSQVKVSMLGMQVEQGIDKAVQHWWEQGHPGWCIFTVPEDVPRHTLEEVQQVRPNQVVILGGKFLIATIEWVAMVGNQS